VLQVLRQGVDSSRLHTTREALSCADRRATVTELFTLLATLRFCTAFAFNKISSWATTLHLPIFMLIRRCGFGRRESDFALQALIEGRAAKTEHVRGTRTGTRYFSAGCACFPNPWPGFLSFGNRTHRGNIYQEYHIKRERQKDSERERERERESPSPACGNIHHAFGFSGACFMH
jgi:hypothetical protein